jgi:iron complex outermembrane receptor protein
LKTGFLSARGEPAHAPGLDRSDGHRHPGAWCRLVVFTVLLALFAKPAPAQTLADLGRMSIDDLANLEVTSVSRTAQPVSQAPAAVYVITSDDIEQSGATSIPEILRLAPNLEVAQTSPSNYSISARGFLGNPQDQNFSNKLLVLIDGRSVYTPLYSGVYWDIQDTMIDDIDRIEVISGPGATLWGANAVNGVINITTRKSAETEGGLLDVQAGNLETDASLRYGGSLADDLTYRVYAKGFDRDGLETPSGENAHDGWSKPQGGFRLDWSPPGDSVTLQGDLYKGVEDQGAAPDQLLTGGNLQASWKHELDGGSTLQAIAYYDQTRRSTDDGGGSFIVRAYDLEVQHSFALDDRNEIVWGAGERASRYTIAGAMSPQSSLLFDPSSRTLNLADAFVQDRISLTKTVNVTLGMKLEDDPYSGVTPMPDLRLSWQASEATLLWAAVSRAIRSPTPFDRDVVEKLGSITFLTGGAHFQPETLTAYQAGYRGQLSTRASLSISTYVNEYDDLKSIETAPGGGIPYYWGNMIAGHVYGVEAWGAWQVANWWRLSAGFSVQRENLRFKPGASELLGVDQEGDDPRHQASLRSTTTLASNVTFDADLRYVGALPNPKVPDYGELNARLDWAATKDLNVSISGLNLLHAHHAEFTPGSDLVERSFVVETRWKF